MTGKQVILDILRNNKDKISKTYTALLGEEINNKKFNIAQALYANEVEYEDAILMVDTTLFGNGKNGFVITEKGVYSRNLGDNYQFYFNEVDKVEAKGSEIQVTKKDGSNFTMRSSLEKGFIDVLNEILQSVDNVVAEDNITTKKVEEEIISLKTLCNEEEAKAIKSIISRIYDESSTFINEVNQVKLANAINAFSPKTNKKNVFAFMDFTIFGSGKDGMIFEYDKVIFKYLNCKFSINYGEYIESKICTQDDLGEILTADIIQKDGVILNLIRKDMPSTKKQFILELISFFEYIKELYTKYDLYKYQKEDNTFEGNIDRILKKYQTTLTTGPINLRGSVDEDKFNKAKKVYAQNAILDQTYLFAQSALLGSSRNGSIITLWGIYSRDFGEDVTVYFGDVEDMNGDAEHLYLTLKNGTKLTVSNSVFNEDKLLLLLKDIIAFYKKFENNPSKYDLENSKYDYIEILKSFNEDLKDKDIDWIKKQYNIGNPYASIELANRYRFGIDVEKEVPKSIEILNSLQSAVANRILGEIYYNGETGNKDTSLAEKHFKIAAKLGDVEAEVWLANFYFLGVNRSVNYTEAFNRYKVIIDRVAEEKLPISIKTNIGLCYRFAYGTTQDYIQAEYWLKNGLEHNPYFKYLVGELYVDLDIFKEQSEKGIEYLNELCEENYALALSKLGELYFVGRHLEIDNAKAYELFKRACELEQVEAYYYFGIMHTLNYHVEPDYQVAFEYISKAAEKLYVPAIRDMALMYQYGIGVVKDIALAKKYFDKAAELDDSYSKEWKLHTKEFLKKVKLINNCINEEENIDFETTEESLLWKSSVEQNFGGLHKVISDYPALIKEEITNHRKDRFTPSDKAIKFGIHGVNIGNTANVTKNFGTFFGAQGHGNAAEYADHVSDLLKFKNAKWLGTDNALHGADRSVNGRLIQTKFCADYSTLRKSCLDTNGNYKYLDSNGKPMVLEVPKDKVDDAIRLMREQYGEDGEKLVKASSLKYKQAFNVAKFGTIDSLMVDAKMGVVTARNAMGITIVMSYATSLISGESLEDATNRALSVGAKTFGVAFCSTVISSQLSRTAFVKGISISDKLVGENMRKVLTKATLPKGSNVLTETMAKNMLKSNIVTSIATTAVLSSADVARLITGRISKEQLCKNVTVTAAGVAGGSAGFYAGAAVGSFILPIPGVGTFVGGLVGASLAGMATSSIAGMTMDEFIKNDGDTMIEIFNKIFEDLAEDYLLAKDEIEYVIDRVTESNHLSASGLRDIYASSNREEYCENIITPFIEEVCELRNFIVTPEADEMMSYAENIVDTEFVEVMS